MKVFCQVLFFVFLGCASRATHVVEAEERQSEGEQGTNSVSLIDEEDEENPEPSIPAEKLLGDVTSEEVEMVLEQRGWKREATFAAGTVGTVLITFVEYRLLKGRNPAHLVPGDLFKAYKRYSKTLGLKKDVVLNFLKGDGDSIQKVKAKMQHLNPYFAPNLHFAPN